MPRASRLRLALSSGAARLGRPSSDLVPPTAMVLTLDDLPPGWVVKGRRQLRAGMAARGEGWADRLYAARGRSLHVAFCVADDPWTIVISQATPTLSADDASAALRTALSNAFTNPDAESVERDQLALPSHVGDEHEYHLLRTRTRTAPEQPGEQHLVLWRRDGVLAFLSAAGRTGSWTPTEVAALAARQDERIRAALGGEAR